MSESTEYIKWKVKFEVTFYGNDLSKGSFREIKESSILFGDDIEIRNKVPFNSKENVEINFLLWVESLPIEKLVTVPHDYYDKNVRYEEESIEVLEVSKSLIF